MDGVLGALVAGLGAGLGVAMPLGAIGVLVLQLGITRGWWPAASAATGVALVDLAYAVVAVAAGLAVSRLLAGHERAVQLAGGAVLLGVAAHGLAGLRRPPGDARPEPPPGRLLLRFVALTAINPLTAVYFAVLAAGLGDDVAGPARAGAFVAGVFVASAAWQLLLAAAGTLTGTRLPAWTRTATSVAGFAVVAGYGIVLALP